MANSAVEVCNLALGALGANLISSLDETSIEATLCNLHWESSRRALLRIHPWNFAIKRIELARDLDVPAYQYKYQYTLPADFLRLLQVQNAIDFKIEGRKILFDQDSCFIKYVSDNSNVAEWDEVFKDLMAARLRFDLSYAITKSSSQVDTSFQIYKQTLVEAKAIDASEDIQDAFLDEAGSLIGVRY